MPMYLKIEGVTGECQDANHVGKSLVFQYRWEASNPNPYPSSNGGLDGLVYSPLRVLRAKDCNVAALVGFMNERKNNLKIVLEEFLTNNNTRTQADLTYVLENVRISRLATASLSDIPPGTAQALMPASVEWIEFDYQFFYLKSYSATNDQSSEYGWNRITNAAWKPS